MNRETSGPGQGCGYCTAMGNAQEMLRAEDTDNQKQICHENTSPHKFAQILEKMVDFSLNVVARSVVLFWNLKKPCDICIHSVYSIRGEKINLSKSKMKNRHKALNEIQQVRANKIVMWVVKCAFKWQGLALYGKIE